LFISLGIVPLQIKKWQIMLGKLPDRNQHEIFHTRLEDLINPQHETAIIV